MKKKLYFISVLLLLVVIPLLFSGCEFFDMIFGSKNSDNDSENSIVGEWEFYFDDDDGNTQRIVLGFNADGSFYEKDYENDNLVI